MNLNQGLVDLVAVALVAALAPIVVAILPGPRIPQVVIFLLGGVPEAVFQKIRERLFTMSHKPMIRLPRTIAWSVWLSIQARNPARNAWLWAGLSTA